MTDFDYARARLNMVNAQLSTNGVHHDQLVDAYTHLAREALVDEAQRPFVYLDEDVRLPNGRFLIDPLVEARMVQEAIKTSPQNVLVLGATNLPAIAMLARFIPKVTVVEPDADICRRSHDRLSARDAAHVTINQGDYTKGHAAGAPYDIIFVPGAMADIPQNLLAQLAIGGKLLCVQRRGMNDQGRIVALRRLPDGSLNTLTLFDAGSPYLAGFEPAREFVF